MAKAGKNYGNESISLLEGAERVRKRPGVIFGSDGLDGCEHAVFEILSNSIDEAREGHGKVITLTHYADGSIEVEDNGRGCPVDWNPKEKRFNWELVYCELYAGGKYNNLDGDNYEYSLQNRFLSALCFLFLLSPQQTDCLHLNPRFRFQSYPDLFLQCPIYSIPMKHQYYSFYSLTPSSQ